MRQETGSKNPKDVISISVRLMSSGVPFLISNYISQSNITEESFLRVELLTTKAALTHKELLGESHVDELAALGIAVEPTEEVVKIEDREFVALVVVPSNMIIALESQFSGRYEFTTPLLRRPVSSEPHVLLDVSDGLATVKIYDRGWSLHFADIYDAPSTASVIFWVQRLASVMILGMYTLYIYRGDGTLSRLLNKNFKNTLYANNKRSI